MQHLNIFITKQSSKLE